MGLNFLYRIASWFFNWLSYGENIKRFSTKVKSKNYRILVKWPLACKLVQQKQQLLYFGLSLVMPSWLELGLVTLVVLSAIIRVICFQKKFWLHFFDTSPKGKHHRSQTTKELWQCKYIFRNKNSLNYKNHMYITYRLLSYSTIKMLHDN